jgi:hypothetical protein
MCLSNQVEFGKNQGSRDLIMMPVMTMVITITSARRRSVGDRGFRH